MNAYCPPTLNKLRDRLSARQRKRLTLLATMQLRISSKISLISVAHFSVNISATNVQNRTVSEGERERLEESKLGIPSLIGPRSISAIRFVYVFVPRERNNGNKIAKCSFQSIDTPPIEFH